MVDLFFVWDPWFTSCNSGEVFRPKFFLPDVDYAIFPLDEDKYSCSYFLSSKDDPKEREKEYEKLLESLPQQDYNIPSNKNLKKLSLNLSK